MNFILLHIVTGHKGPLEEVKKEHVGRCNRLKSSQGRETLEREKSPIFRMIQRTSEVMIKMMSNVKRVNIEPIIHEHVKEKSVMYTDEYNIYDRLECLGYEHKTVCHSKHEYTRDEDGDGFCEVHVNTIEGFWSLLRSWLRVHRGISQ